MLDLEAWIPAFAGMTADESAGLAPDPLIDKPV